MWPFSKADERSIEQLVFDIAERSRRRDMRLLLKKLNDRHVFAPYPVDPGGGTPEGKNRAATSEERWPVEEIGGYTVLKCLTGRNNPVCENGAISMTFESAKELIAEARLDGMYLHNGISSWCVILNADLGLR